MRQQRQAISSRTLERMKITAMRDVIASYVIAHLGVKFHSKAKWKLDAGRVASTLSD